MPTRDTSWETGLCVVAKIPRVYSVAEDPAPLWPEKAAHPLNSLSTGQGEMLEKPPPQRENQLRHVHQVGELGLSTQRLLLDLAARHASRSSFSFSSRPTSAPRSCCETRQQIISQFLIQSNMSSCKSRSSDTLTALPSAALSCENMIIFQVSTDPSSQTADRGPQTSLLPLHPTLSPVKSIPPL